MQYGQLDMLKVITYAVWTIGYVTSDNICSKDMLQVIIAAVWTCYK